MTYTEIVEIVAKAIYCDRNGQGAKPWSILTKSHKAPYQSDAAAALSAIKNSGLAIAPREASEKMKKAGVELALSATISADNRWPDYVTNLNRTMVEAGEVKP